VSILRVDDVVPLQGPGLIAGTATIEAKKAAIAVFVATTLRAMDVVTADPELGLEAAIVAVPELASGRGAQLAVLEATIETWRGTAQESGGLGALDRDGWTASIEYLTTLGLVPNPVSVDDLLHDATARSDA
jgi:ABC-type nitrate/sulfonate/bicarbonate transport system substrate-binding protein